MMKRRTVLALPLAALVPKAASEKIGTELYTASSPAMTFAEALIQLRDRGAMLVVPPRLMQAINEHYREHFAVNWSESGND
jgi:hypothetical protein